MSPSACPGPTRWIGRPCYKHCRTGRAHQRGHGGLQVLNEKGDDGWLIEQRHHHRQHGRQIANIVADSSVGIQHSDHSLSHRHRRQINPSAFANLPMGNEIRLTFNHVIGLLAPLSNAIRTGLAVPGFAARESPLKRCSKISKAARIDEFLSWFPGVSREMAEAVLVHAQRSLQTEAH